MGAEDIVAKFPEFLQFVKRVQSVICSELRHSNIDTWKFNQPVISDMIHQIKGSSTTLSCSSMRYIFSREDNNLIIWWNVSFIIHTVAKKYNIFSAKTIRYHCTSSLTDKWILRCLASVHYFRSQMTSKCGKNKRVAREAQ